MYPVDQPRRGNAGRSTTAATLTPVPDGQQWFNTVRLGAWPESFPSVQFARASDTLNPDFRSMMPSTGPIDMAVMAAAVSALFDRIRPGMLITHSHSGGMGWVTAAGNDAVRAIVSYEPGSGFIFPGGEVPEVMPSAAGPLTAVAVPEEDFLQLTRLRIIVYSGDNIPTRPTDLPGQDGWRIRPAMARQWRELVNYYGGDVQVAHLPEIGITGNTHLPFSDHNNRLFADHLADCLPIWHWMASSNYEGTTPLRIGESRRGLTTPEFLSTAFFASSNRQTKTIALYLSAIGGY